VQLHSCLVQVDVTPSEPHHRLPLGATPGHDRFECLEWLRQAFDDGLLFGRRVEDEAPRILASAGDVTHRVGLQHLERIRDVGQTPVEQFGPWRTTEVTALVEAATVFSPDAMPSAEWLATSLTRLAAYIDFRAALSNNPDDHSIRRNDNLTQQEWLVQFGNANVALQRLFRLSEPPPVV
jgi:hypothetical protein